MELDPKLDIELGLQITELRKALDVISNAATSVLELELLLQERAKLIHGFKAGVIQEELGRRGSKDAATKIGNEKR